jgi:hypothetical protein
VCALEATRTSFASIFRDARDVANVNHLVISESMKCTLVADVSSVLRRSCDAALSARPSWLMNRWSTVRLLS